MSEPARFLMIARACGPDPDSPYIQFRIGFSEEPTAGQVGQAESTAAKQFALVSTVPPARVGVVVLPWVEDDEDPA